MTRATAAAARAWQALARPWRLPPVPPLTVTLLPRTLPMLPPGQPCAGCTWCDGAAAAVTWSCAPRTAKRFTLHDHLTAAAAA